MILKTLKLKNFRCFKNLQLDFDENLIAFIGNNGSGKTSIFEAIFYALFGFGHSLERGGKSYIIHDGSDEILCEIELVFDLDELEYKIQRRIKGKVLNVEAFLYRGDNPNRPIAERDAGVTNEIQRLLGMTYQTFKISVFSAQKELDAFTELQPEKRKEEIRKLLNLNMIKESVGFIRSDARDTQVRIETLRGQIQDTVKLNKDLQDFLIQEKTKNSELEKLNSTITALNKELIALKSANKELGKTRDKVQKLESEIENTLSLQKRTQEDLKNLINQIENLKQKKKYLEQNKSIKSIYIKLQEEYEKLNKLARKKEKEQSLLRELKGLNTNLKESLTKQKELSKSLQPLKTFQEELASLEKTIEQKNLIVKKLNTELARLEEVILTLKKEESETNTEIKKFEDLGKESPCPECGRPLGDHYDFLLKKFSTKLSNNNTKQKELGNKQKTLKAKLYQGEKNIASLKDKESRIDVAIKNLNSIQGELSGTKTQETKVRNQIDSKKEELNKLGKIEFDNEYLNTVKTQINSKRPIYEKFISIEGEVKSLPNLLNQEKTKQQEIAGLNDRWKTLVSDRKSINFNEEGYKLSEQKQVDLEDKYTGMFRMQGNLKLEVVKFNLEIAQTKKEIKKQKDLQKEIKSREAELTQLTRLENLLIEFEMDLLIRIRPLLELRASELIRATTKGKYVSLELDESYTPYLYDLNKKYELKRFSGGEQDLVNLCLRIAVSDIVAERAGGRHINFLVLDEIFGSQDEERRGEILNMLQELTSQFRQIFLITHVDDFKDSMPIVYQVKELSHHNSTVQLV